MKHTITALALTLTAYFTLAPQSFAQDADQEKTPASPPAKNQDTAAGPMETVRQNFIKLPEEKRKEFGDRLLKAQNLFNQKRIFDTLQEVDELDRIFKGHPSSLNIRGACYVEIRAFDKAYPIFEEILRLSPKNTNVRFNLAEVDFVTKKWESAHNRFSELIPLLSPRNIAMVRLCEFKLLLCKLKLNREQEAIALRDKYDSWDDSPFYHYAHAAIHYHQGDDPAAEKMLSNARFIWGNPAVLASWQDTMIEVGYVRSFYGGNTDKPEGVPENPVKPATEQPTPADSQ